MNKLKMIKERKLVIDSLVDNAYFVSKKAKYYQSIKETCRKVFEEINLLNYEEYKKHLKSAFELLNYDFIEEKVNNIKYIVISRNLEKILIYIEKNKDDILHGYLSQAITISFATNLLHCTNKCVVTTFKKEDISKEYINDCKTHQISLLDYSWNESMLNLITSNITNEYEKCKEKIKELSDLIIKIKNEPFKRSKDKPRFEMSDIITDDELKEVETRLKLDIMDDVFTINPIS